MKRFKRLHYLLWENGWFIPIGILIIMILSILTILQQVAPTETKTTISATSTLPVVHTWTKTDSLAYAHDQVLKDAEAQFTCLSNLWSKESAWNHKAFNPVKVMGKNAGGIPQLLGMSPLTQPTEQIDRGLKYISFRYILPCNALKHFNKKGWY